MMDMVSDDTQEHIASYIRNRLREECASRGTQHKISIVTGITDAHLSNIRDGSRKAWYQVAMKLASYWGMTFAELESAAAGVAGNPVVPISPIEAAIIVARTGSGSRHARCRLPMAHA